jgi:phage-related protein
MADGRIEIDTRIEKGNVEQELRELQRQFNQLHREMMQGQRKALLPYQKQILEVEKKFFELGKDLHDFGGTNRDLMERIRQLGAEHKKATDNMIKNNHFLTQSYIRQAATFMNASTHAEKLHGIYQKTNPLLAKYTAGTLKAQAALQRFANSGSAAQIALEVLGKNADPKKLRDFATNLNQSLMHVPILAAGAAAAFGALTAAIAKAAKGPDVSKIKEQINQTLAAYRDTLRQRTQEIYDTWQLFAKAQINAIKPKTLLQNLQSQVKIMQQWLSDLQKLSKRGVDEGLIQELRKMGPAAAGEIHALTQMSDSALNKYVQLWKQKHQLASTAATTELEKLKEKTREKIQQLKDSITPLGASLEQFKSTWAQALEPFVKTWGIIFSKIVDAATAVGNLINKLNSISPVISTAIFSILYLTTAFTVLAIPMALVGKWMLGLRAIAFMFLKPMSAMASLMGTSITIAFGWAAAIVGVAVALYLLWQRSETFRNAVITGWNMIKETAVTVWNFILNQVLIPIWTAIVQFGSQLFTQFRQFWEQNGRQIIQAVQNAWNMIKTIISAAMAVLGPIIQIGWALIVNIVKSTWDAIKNIIDGAMKVIQGIIKVFTGIFTGDFSLLWEGIKQIFFGALQAIWGWVNLYFIGKFLGPLKSFGSSAKTIIQGAWTFIKGLFTNTLNAIKTVLVGSFNAMKNSVNGTMNLIKNIISGAWNAAKNIVVSVLGGIRTVVATIWNTIKNTISSTVNTAKSLVSNAFNAMKNTVSSIMNQVSGAIRNGWNKAVSFLKSINLYSIGRNIIEGLIRGIKAMIGSVANAISEVAGNIKNRIKNALGIHSPSLVMQQEVGRWIPIGLARGIDQHLDAVIAAANRMVQATIPNIPAPTTPNIEAILSKFMPQPQAVAQTTGERPITLVLQLGRNDYTAFVKDITQEQQLILRRSSMY